jgi:hypothetical protein
MEAQEIRISKPVSPWSLCPDVVFKGDWFSPTKDRLSTLDYEFRLALTGWYRHSKVMNGDREISTWRPRRNRESH